jgi:hypothetical protein
MVRALRCRDPERYQCGEGRSDCTGTSLIVDSGHIASMYRDPIFLALDRARDGNLPHIILARSDAMLAWA